ncbi:hypothetical protein FPOAC1_003389 [Fusarium poae]|uniref:hypothetical protein n=1 Tax=Fusarium poae TaxID=36050 RepID=UPI001CEA5E33|nr:hypothetical protein FPOAC1_003389 [Fusarium poae]KAG8677373.1 hypothetical protein FPOAC1_003389 [Fusarium poae]
MQYYQQIGELYSVGSYIDTTHCVTPSLSFFDDSIICQALVFVSTHRYVPLPLIVVKSNKTVEHQKVSFLNSYRSLMVPDGSNNFEIIQGIKLEYGVAKCSRCNEFK